MGAFMTSPIGDLPINSDGLRKAVDELDRLRAENNRLNKSLEYHGGLVERMSADNSYLQGELTRIKEAIKIKGGDEHAPTQDAYDAACRALQRQHEENDTLRVEHNEMVKEFIGIAKDGSEICQTCRAMNESSLDWCEECRKNSYYDEDGNINTLMYQPKFKLRGPERGGEV